MIIDRQAREYLYLLCSCKTLLPGWCRCMYSVCSACFDKCGQRVIMPPYRGVS